MKRLKTYEGFWVDQRFFYDDKIYSIDYNIGVTIGKLEKTPKGRSGQIIGYYYKGPKSQPLAMRYNITDFEWHKIREATEDEIEVYHYMESVKNYNL